MNKKFAAIFALLIITAPMAWAQHTITTVAGGGPSSVPLSAAIYDPDAVFKDASGNLYIAATGADAIYKINSTGKLTTVAGTGTAGFSGEGGPATSAQLNGPTDVFVDSSGNIFIADANNSVIREIVAATGDINTVAGIPGFAVYNGDGIPATTAELNGPTGVTVDGSGNIFIAEINGCRIREVVASTGNIQTVAGTTGAGTPGPAPTGNCGYNGNGIAANTAKLNGPSAVVLDSSGNLYLTDQGNYCVRKVASTGQITDVAGTCTVLLAPTGADGDGGPATSALFQRPVRLFVDGHENVYISDIADNRMREVVAATGDIQTVAGTGTAGFTGEGGLATQAELDQPSGVWVDASGNIFLTDSLNNRVREVTASNGFIQTIAGDGSGDGDGGPATGGLLNAPFGVAVDGTGNLFIADTANSVIREAVAATGNITTVAGTFTAGFDGDGLALNVDLNNPNGVFVDGSGDIFIADSQNKAIREVINGDLTTVVGESDGVLTNVLNYPTAVFVDGSGNIFIADSGNNVIEKVAAVVVEGTPAFTVVAGTGTAGFTGNGGPATTAELNAPSGVFLDSSGNIFIADSLNDVIREVVAATGNIETVAGNGTAGFSGDAGPATSAQLDYPLGVFVDSSGNIFIADSNNNAVREVLAATGNIRSVAGSSGNAGFSGDGGPAASAELNYTASVFGDNQSNLYVADVGNSRIRKIAGIVTGAPANITASGGTPQSATVGAAFATPLSATVTDAFGNLVAGVVVTFTASEIGASGSFPDGVLSLTVTTGPAGVAITSLPFTANTIAGSYTVTASVAGVDTLANFSLTNNPGPPASVTATGGTPQGAPINTVFATPLSATVTDASGNTVPGVNVIFTAPASGASGIFAGGSATSPPEATNAQGIATAPTFTANVTQGSYNVTAAVAGVALPANFALTNQPPPPLTITTASLPGGQVNLAYSQTLAATGGLTPYSWSISTGALPAGLTLNAATGVISGTASAVGASNFTAKVTDSEAPAASQTANLSITITGNLATLQVLPQPNTAGFGASVQFYAQDASGNAIPVTWSISPATGAGTVSAAGLYQAPASGTASGTVKVTATAVADATKQSSVSFTLASNGLSACCTLPQQLTVAAGSTTSTPTGVQLNGVPSTSTVPFTLSCTGLPVGAACAFTLPTKLGGGPTQVISGSSTAAFCYVITTGAGGTAGGTGAPLSPPSNPLPNSPLNALVAFGAGLLVLALAAWRTPKTMPRWKLAFMSIALVGVTVAVMGACSGFSPGNVPLPNAQVTPAGTYQIQILATPPSGSGFVQTQLIVPLTVH